MNFLKKIFSKPKQESAEVPPEFLQEEPADWLIGLKGKELPAETAFSIRAQLSKSQRTGSAEILVFQGPSGQPRPASVVLERTEIDRLFIILGFSFPHEIETVPSDDSGGLPVTISIYSEQPFMLRTADCNLAGWLDSKKAGPPAVEIGRILLDLKNRALPP